MSTMVLELKLPEDVYLALRSAGLERDELGAHAMRDLAMQLYCEGRLSLGKAARLAGLRLLNFWLLLVERGLPVFNYSEEEYETDLALVRRLAAREAQT